MILVLNKERTGRPVVERISTRKKKGALIKGLKIIMVCLTHYRCQTPNFPVGIPDRRYHLGTGRFAGCTRESPH